ncbi:MAG: hypothetical protein VKL59_11835 [Nostocaceae cyanobacterium]|nr:hypothetical protein [Nostocaceae cyanobacterium]
MFKSCELRWFYPGRVPEAMDSWFQQNCLSDALKPPESREDVYLWAPGCDYMGIKLRQGRLEVKWRQAELGILRFGEYVEGKAERWTKWICEDYTQQSFQPAKVSGNPIWVNVQKVRYAQLYELETLNFGSVHPSIPQPVLRTEYVENGCSVELTHLVIQGNPWWTFAFEAFGEESCLVDNIEAVANLVFHNDCALRLQPSDSCSYPSWLNVSMKNN